MIKCVIIDDEKPAVDIIKSYVSQDIELNLVASFTNPIKALEWLSKEKVDLVFLDIQMSKLNGIEVMKRLDRSINVIFCTAYSEFAVEGFELEAVDYLMKPISVDRFNRAVQRAKKAIKPNGAAIESELIYGDDIFVKTEHKGKMLKVDLIDILYIEAKGNYVEINLKGKKILTYTTMKGLEDRLPSKAFMRIHKSYIVGLTKIIELENSELKLQGGISIPLSLNYKEAFMDRVKDKVVSH